MVPPVRELMHREFEILIDKLRINALEIGIGPVARLHHADEAVAQLFPRHAERNDIRAVLVAGLVIVQPTSLFEPIVKWRCWYRVQHAYQRG